MESLVDNIIKPKSSQYYTAAWELSRVALKDIRRTQTNALQFLETTTSMCESVSQMLTKKVVDSDSDFEEYDRFLVANGRSW